MFMEWSLALGTNVYFFAGMAFVSLGHIQGHIICMNMLMITAFGPGFFRVLRHAREFVTGRLFQPSNYKNYLDVVGTAHLRNFRCVESSYFCMAFVFTDAYAAFVFHQTGVFADPEWRRLALAFVALPIAFLVFGILLRCFPCLTDLFWPGQSEDFNWYFCLDYDWNVLEEPLVPEGCP